MPETTAITMPLTILRREAHDRRRPLRSIDALSPIAHRRPRRAISITPEGVF
jgi:hypothetical protein